MLRLGILCYDIVGQAKKIFCCDRAFLCRDKVGQGKKKLCRDRAILCRDRFGKNREKLCHNRGLPGRDKAGHGRGAMSPQQSWACTTGMRAQLGCAHDRGARTIEACVRQRNSITTEISLSQQTCPIAKKIMTLGFGASQFYPIHNLGNRVCLSLEKEKGVDIEN